MSQKVILLKINNIHYKVKTTVPLGLLSIILNQEGATRTFEERVAESILYAIEIEDTEDTLSVEKLLEVGDDIFHQYIDAIINSNASYINHYNSRPETEPICERFCKALQDYTRESMADLSKKMSTIVAQTSQPLIEMANSWSGIISKVCEPVLSISTVFADAVKKTSSITESFNRSLSSALESITQIQENVFKQLHQVTKVWNNIDWDTLAVSYRKWGEYGWTSIEYASFDFFSNEPKSQIFADQLALKFFNKKGLEILFDDLRKLEINKKDLESAIFCFNSKQYKASSMLLFAMIEAPFIKRQPIDQTRRKVGKGAIKRFNSETVEKESLEKNMFLYLHATNVFSFLTTLFDDANNFKAEPQSINRNFINHGMSKRYVRKKDCIKLFLGLYNIIEMFEFYKD